jgi:pre-mRNA-splicing factor SPF27
MSSGDTQPAQLAMFDALPYYDNDLEQFPALRQKVEQELAREGKPPETLHPRVPPAIELFVVRALDVSF